MSSSFIPFLACAVASVLFGSNYLALYAADARLARGPAFALAMAFGIALTGVVVLTSRDKGTVRYEPLAFVGGALWATGNAFSSETCARLGVGAAMSAWSGVALVTGWTCARFGAFGMPRREEKPSTAIVVELVGVALAISSVIIGAMVSDETSAKEDVERSQRSEVERLLGEARDGEFDDVTRRSSESDWGTVEQKETEDGEFASASADHEIGGRRGASFGKKFPYVMLAAFCGVCYGVNFNPVEYLRAHASEGHSAKELDYVPSHFAGILATAATHFCIYHAYCAVTKRRTTTNVNAKALFWKLFVPAAASGIMWGAAQTAWFVANERLSATITWPIMACAPPAVASAWDVFYFKKINTDRNRSLIAASNVARLAAVLCVVAAA